VSARKVMMDMGPPYSSGVELISFHTVSKGSLGECGLRGGYFEFTNIMPEAVEEMYKVASVNLCPNVTGQVRGLCKHPRMLFNACHNCLEVAGHQPSSVSFFGRLAVKTTYAHLLAVF
jgi:hypothetical protein